MGLASVELTGSDAPADARFGAAVSVEGDLALVGAPGPFALSQFAAPSPPQAGTGYVFRRTGTGWDEVARLTPAGGVVAGLSAVLLDGEAYLGSPLGNQAQGAVFRFGADADGAWSQTGTIGAALARSGGLLRLLPRPGGGRATPWSEHRAPTPSRARRTPSMQVTMAPGARRPSWRPRPAGSWASWAARWLEVTASPWSAAPGSEFFEGIGFVFERDDGGAWSEAAPIHEAESGLAAVIGEEQQCSDDGMVAGIRLCRRGPRLLPPRP